MSDVDFNEKYRTYGNMLFRICMVYLGTREDAEEAMQETFMRLLYNSPDFSGNEHEKAWIIRVAVNKCKDMLRSSWRKKVFAAENMEEYGGSVEEVQVMNELLNLPPKYKAAILLHYYEDLPVRQIAGILGIGESAVKMRLKRGREILKLELEGEEQ
jgi:RNA polymerase sigma-70 factor (ECF subfamily)